jgi:hypothetical protein
MVDAAEKATAEAHIFQLLGKLNLNDWQRIRPLVKAEAFQRMVEHANDEALGPLL